MLLVGLLTFFFAYLTNEKTLADVKGVRSCPLIKEIAKEKRTENEPHTSDV